jgi:hypothetical protein
MMVAMVYLPAACSFALKASTTGLLRPDILNIEAVNPGELRQVIDIAAGFDHRQHVARPDRRLLLRRQAELCAIGLWIAHELGAVLSAVEGEAHSVQRQAFLRLGAVENRGSGDLMRARHARTSLGRCARLQAEKHAGRAGL